MLYIHTTCCKSKRTADTGFQMMPMVCGEKTGKVTVVTCHLPNKHTKQILQRRYLSASRPRAVVSTCIAFRASPLGFSAKSYATTSSNF